jgi:hypothetical protein
MCTIRAIKKIINTLFAVVASKNKKENPSKKQVVEMENSLCSLLAWQPAGIERSTLECQVFPQQCIFSKKKGRFSRPSHEST